MFVRFRVQVRRLNASLIQTRRVAGKMQTEHVASLGSVDADLSIRERLAFWAKLPERLTRLGNRVNPDQHDKIYAALHARIPMVTPDEQRALQEAKELAELFDQLSPRELQAIRHTQTIHRIGGDAGLELLVLEWGRRAEKAKTDAARSTARLLEMLELCADKDRVIATILSDKQRRAAKRSVQRR